MNWLNSDTFASKLILQLISSSLAFSGALFVAYRIYRLNKKKEERYRKELKEDSDIEILNYIKSSIEFTLPAIDAQSANFEQLINELKNENEKSLQFVLTTNFQCIWIDSIDKIRLRRIFYEYNPESAQKKADQYYDLINFSRHFNEIYNSIKEDLYYHIKGIQDKDEMLKSDYLKLKRLIVETLNYFPEFPEFPSNVPKHIADIQNFTIDFTKKLKPNEDYNYKQIGEFTSELKKIYVEHQLGEWMPEINKVLYHYEDLKVKYENTIGLLNTYIQGFEEGYKILDDILRSLKKINRLPS